MFSVAAALAAMEAQPETVHDISVAPVADLKVNVQPIATKDGLLEPLTKEFTGLVTVMTSVGITLTAEVKVMAMVTGFVSGIDRVKVTKLIVTLPGTVYVYPVAASALKTLPDVSVNLALRTIVLSTVGVVPTTCLLRSMV